MILEENFIMKKNILASFLITEKTKGKHEEVFILSFMDEKLNLEIRTIIHKTKIPQTIKH